LLQLKNNLAKPLTTTRKPAYLKVAKELKA
jgi:hypothetical protein